MSCEIIQLSAFGRPARTVSENTSAAEVTAFVDRGLTPRLIRRLGKPELPPPATETAKNYRLRNARRDAWWHAGQVADYWRARLDWQSALDLAQQYKIGDSGSFPPPREIETRGELCDKWRAAVVKKLLTPAHDLAAITWKRAQLAGRGFSRLPIKTERIEQAIADDVAFLAAHPTRRKRGERS
jgi:hypothetical protein